MGSPPKSRIPRSARRGRVPSIAVARLLLAACALLAGAVELRAQEPPVAIASDSLADSLRARLQRASRAAGDSTGLALADSLEREGAGQRPEASSVDSVQSLLNALPGYDIVHYRADSAEFNAASRVLVLLGSQDGPAEMEQAGTVLQSDSAIVFDETSGRLVTLGQEASYSPDAGDPVRMKRIVYDLNEARGSALDAATETSSGLGSWTVRGDFPFVNDSLQFGSGVMFTSCQEDEPHYHFVADQIKMGRDGTLVARNVRLVFGDVPVFWLPFLTQNMEQGRRSGILPVQFSVNDIVRSSGDYARRISNLGYYWAMSQYSDAELALDWWSGNYTALNGSMQYRWARQFLEGNFSMRRFWASDGGVETTLRTSHSWEQSERLQVRVSGAYASSADFVRQNSFDPREVTQSIDSEGGVNRRFDWGTLAVSANRRQFLSEDRIETTLPNVSLSLSSITLLPAPGDLGRFYNNMTFTASGRFSRSLSSRPPPANPEEFSLRDADSERRSASFRTSLGAGNLRISQNTSYEDRIAKSIPAGFFDPDPLPAIGLGSVADLSSRTFFQAADHGEEEIKWSASIDYQQQLVGSTTITPRLSLSGRSIRSDTTSALGGGFTGAPRRMSFGAQLKTDIYGFYRGRSLRHKLSPSFEYAYSPEVVPNEVQIATFGGRAAQPTNELRFSITQTFEAKSEDGEGAEDAELADEEEAEAEAQDDAASAQDSAEVSLPQAALGDPSAGEGDDGPRRLQQARSITILAWRTSALTYDFEQASELGHFTRGFQDNLTISNQFSSDYLRGLSVAIDHDIFDDSGAGPNGGARGFSPMLSRANLSFSLSGSSTVFRWLRGLTGGEAEAERSDEGAQDGGEAGEEAEEADPFEDSDDAVMPRVGGRVDTRAARRTSGSSAGTWDLQLSYALARNRLSPESASQMLQSTLSFDPTPQWSVNWRTSFDLESGRFNDQMVSLRRELHRWEADFSFRQTALGNWTFMFQVELTDNPDLRFEHVQRPPGGTAGSLRDQSIF